MPRSARALVMVLVPAVSLSSFAAGAARADEPVEPPSPALLGVGIAVAVGGGALAYYGAHRYVDSNGASLGDLGLNLTGTLLMEAGGALGALWGWQLGESNFAYDLGGNVPLRSRRPLALVGIAIGAAALVANYVGSAIIVGKDVSCVRDDDGSQVRLAAFQSCAKDAVLTATVIDLAAGGVLLVAAPLAGYGFGYDSAARDAGHPLVSVRGVVAPTVFAGGGGLALSGRF